MKMIMEELQEIFLIVIAILLLIGLGVFLFSLLPEQKTKCVYISIDTNKPKEISKDK